MRDLETSVCIWRGERTSKSDSSLVSALYINRQLYTNSSICQVGSNLSWWLEGYQSSPGLFFSSTFNYFHISTLEDTVESILESCLVNLMIVNSDTTFWSYSICNVLTLWPQRWASSHVTHFVSMLRTHSAILFIYLFILFSIITIVYLKNVW